MKNNLLVTMTTIDFQSLLERMLDAKLSFMHVEKEKQPRDVALISRLEVAKLFGVSKTTIDKWRRARILSAPLHLQSCGISTPLDLTSLTRLGSARFNFVDTLR